MKPRMKLNGYIGLCLVAATLLVHACSDNDKGTEYPNTLPDLPNDEVMYWNEKVETVLNVPNFQIDGQSSGMTPPAQCRFFAMAQIAVHDALNSIEPAFETHALRGISDRVADPNAAIAAASYWTLKKLNLQANFPLDLWYEERLNKIPEGDAKTHGLKLGEQAADAIIAKRANENLLVANQQLPGPDGTAPGEYRSTLWFSAAPANPKIKALKDWGTEIQPFVLERNDQFRPKAPYSIQSQQYVNDFNEVKNLGGAHSTTRTAQQEEITKFWIERFGSTWNRFARNYIKDKNIDAWTTARLFAMMNVAMADMCTAGFNAKYHYFTWRPETAIRIDDDGNPNTQQDPDWLPFFIESPNADPSRHVYCPPIPEYPSVHSGAGSAATTILRILMGTDQILVRHTSLGLPGVERELKSFTGAAQENALARLYAGHYFRTSLDAGMRMGEDIATYVHKHAFKRK